jgi:hypothetical protein
VQKTQAGFNGIHVEKYLFARKPLLQAIIQSSGCMAVVIAPITKENSAHDTPSSMKSVSPFVCLLAASVPEIRPTQKRGK